MDYMTTATNQSPLIRESMGAAASVARGKALKFNSDGNAVLAGKGEAAIGIVAISNDENLQTGDGVDIQIKDRGVVLSGAAFAKGAALAADKDGAFVTAEAGDHVLAIALEKAAKAGVMAKAVLTHYEKPAAAAPAGGNDNQ